MHFAKIDTSPRLQRVLAVLRKYGALGVTTRGLMIEADVCAPSTTVCELRRSGYVVACTQEGRGRFRYRLIGRTMEAVHAEYEKAKGVKVDLAAEAERLRGSGGTL